MHTLIDELMFPEIARRPAFPPVVRAISLRLFH
jgi:hypothetical protein